ncbi:MAG: SCO family protein [Betaproteobacteria bacterium]
MNHAFLPFSRLHARLGSAIVLALLLCASGPALAALFYEAGKNLAYELKTARHEGRQLAVFFELPDCPGCQEMKKQVFSEPRAENNFKRRYRSVHIDLASSEVVVDPQGRRSTPQELAQRWNIVGTPAFAFFAADGNLNYRHVGSLPDPADFISLGRFVAEAAYENLPFAEYRLRYGRALFAAASPLATQAPDFELRDQHGKIRHLADFRGKTVVLAVGYMFCPDVCPTTLFELKTVLGSLGSDAGQVQVLFATLDPERDSAKALGAYVSAFHKSFIGLRGNATQTAELIRRFSLIADKQAPSSAGYYTVDHTAGVFLFDRQGQLRGFSPYGQPLDLLTADLKKLAREGRSTAVQLSQR